MHRPLILISNDDGYAAPGINYLIDIARQFGDVIAVAPDGGRSGASLSVTFSAPITPRLISKSEGVEIYACNGTPCDCTKLGLDVLSPRLPDLVLGGINHGDNSAINVHYSGTMGVVIEGCLKGLPSIGFSHQSHSLDTDFSTFRPYIERILRHVLDRGLKTGVCLNVNAPDTLEYQGLKVCEMGHGAWHKELLERPHPHGGNYYWMVGHFVSEDSADAPTDWNWLQKGYVTVTPTQVDITAYDQMALLRESLENH